MLYDIHYLLLYNFIKYCIPCIAAIVNSCTFSFTKIILLTIYSILNVTAISFFICKILFSKVAAALPEQRSFFS